MGQPQNPGTVGAAPKVEPQRGAPGRQPYGVGVTGHRALGDTAQVEHIRARCHELLATAKAQHPTIEALTAIAEGADSLFAEEALALGIPLRVVIPFATYVEDFPVGPVRERHLRLK